MQKAIRPGLALDESLTTSQIGEYINYRTAAYRLAIQGRCTGPQPRSVSQGCSSQGGQGKPGG